MIGRQVFRIARRGLFAAVVRHAFAHAAPLLPLRRVALTRHALAVHHPRPTHAVHVLVVPRRSIRSLIAIDDGDLRTVTGWLALLDRLGDDFPGMTLVVNGGAAQDIDQLHAHLIVRDGARTGRASWPLALAPPFAAGALAAILADLRTIVSTHDLARYGYSLIVPPRTAGRGLDWAAARLVARNGGTP